MLTQSAWEMFAEKDSHIIVTSMILPGCFIGIQIKYSCSILTHWGRETHICVGKLTIIGSDNGLSSIRRQAIIWTIVGISLIGPLGTNFSEILKVIQTFSFKKMHLKMSSAKWGPFVSASMCYLISGHHCLREPSSNWLKVPC